MELHGTGWLRLVLRIDFVRQGAELNKGERRWLVRFCCVCKVRVGAVYGLLPAAPQSHFQQDTN